jgi:hypothetical protein
MARRISAFDFEHFIRELVKKRKSSQLFITDPPYSTLAMG